MCIVSCMTEHATVCERLTAFWWETGDKPAVRQSSAIEVVELEQRYRVVLPDDFRSYLLHVIPNEMRSRLESIKWWSVDRIRNINETYGASLRDPIIADVAEECLFFADYSNWKWGWAICCAKGEHYGKVALIGGFSDYWVANSFAEFVTRYIVDVKLIRVPANVFKVKANLP